MINLHSKVKAALEKIDFAKRYEQVSNTFNKEKTPLRERLRYLDGEIVLDSLTQLGYNAHFESKEKYFWIEEVKIGTYTFSSNIILYGGTMLYRYAQSKGYDTTQGGMAVREYADYEQISGYAMEAMTWAVNTGLISGTSTTTLSPQGEATRAQVATILMRFIEGNQ